LIVNAPWPSAHYRANKKQIVFDVAMRMRWISNEKTNEQGHCGH